MPREWLSWPSLIAALGGGAAPPGRGGFVTACSGGTITASGLAGRAGVGEVCLIERRRHGARASALFDERDALLAEIVGFGDAGVQLRALRGAARDRPRRAGRA